MFCVILYIIVFWLNVLILLTILSVYIKTYPIYSNFICFYHLLIYEYIIIYVRRKGWIKKQRKKYIIIWNILMN